MCVGYNRVIWIMLAGLDVTAGPPVPTGEFPGGPASFVMRRSGPEGPINTGKLEKTL